MRVLNGVLFYLGWVVCLWGAANDAAWVGVLVTALIVALHLALSPQRLKDCIMVLIGCFAGTLMDSAYIANGLIRYASPNVLLPWMAPFWVISLYALLATSIDSSLAWLKNRPVLAALLGSTGAVACYLGGERVGVAVFERQALIVVGLMWVLFMPAFVAVSAWLDHCLPSRSDHEQGHI